MKIQFRKKKGFAVMKFLIEQQRQGISIEVLLPPSFTVCLITRKNQTMEKVINVIIAREKLWFESQMAAEYVCA